MTITICNKYYEQVGKEVVDITEEIPFDIPDNWAWRRMANYCEIRFGTRVVKNQSEGSQYYVYGGGGATFKVDNYNRENALLVSRFAMSKQCTRYVNGKFFLNDSGLSLHADKVSLSQEFLNYAIFANNDIIYGLGRGAAQKNLNMQDFSRLLMPLPPLAEQQRIVEKIDNLFAHLK